MKLLVLGGSGMLGHRAAAVLSQRHDVVATVRAADPVVAGFAPRVAYLAGVTVEDIGSVANAIRDMRPDAVVNCIGIVKQLAASHDAVPSIRTNALFPHQVAELCSAAGVRMVQVSTDCVFGGWRGGYTESDPPDATDLYGRSKLLGEVTDTPGVVTIRTSIIGWELRHPTGVLEWFARQRGGSCDGYTKAVFSGLTTTDLAGVIEGLCTTWRDLDGLWNVSMEPIDKYALLTRVRDALGWDIEVRPVDEPAIDRSLDSTRFRDWTGWKPRPWAEAIAALAKERPAYDAALGRM